MSGSLEAVAQALRENRPSGGTVMHPGDWQEWVAETAAEIVTALELREEVSVRVGQLVGCVMSRPEAEANPAAEIVAWRWVSSWTSGSDNR